jgi:hypothetical protein
MGGKLYIKFEPYLGKTKTGAILRREGTQIFRDEANSNLLVNQPVQSVMSCIVSSRYLATTGEKQNMCIVALVIYSVQISETVIIILIVRFSKSGYLQQIPRQGKHKSLLI